MIELFAGQKKREGIYKMEKGCFAVLKSKDFLRSQ